jgi:hypothetical protein
MNLFASLRARLTLLTLVLAFGLLALLAGCASGSPGRYGAPPPVSTPATSVPGY